MALRTTVSFFVVLIIALIPTAFSHAQTINLSGSILQSDQEPLSGVTVTLTNTATQETKTTITDQQGNYSFFDLAPGTYRISPKKQDASNTNISAVDAVFVLQGVVGIKTLTPEQRMIADVSGDGILSAVDAVMILQKKVELISRFVVGERCSSDWLFLPFPHNTATLTNPNITITSCQNGEATISFTASTPTTQNFTALQFGDVSGSVAGAALTGSGGGGAVGGEGVFAQPATCSWYSLSTSSDSSDSDLIPNSGWITQRAKAPSSFGDGFLFSYNEGNPGGTLHKGVRCTTTITTGKTGPYIIATGAGGSFLKVLIDDKLVRSTRAPDARLLETELSAGTHTLRIEYQHYQLKAGVSIKEGVSGEAPHPDWFVVGLLPVPDDHWIGVKYIDRQKEYQAPEVIGSTSKFLRQNWQAQTSFVAVLAGNFDFPSAGTYTFRKDANGSLNLFTNSFRDGVIQRAALIGNLPGAQQADSAQFVVDNSAPAKSTGILTLLALYRSAGPSPSVQLRWSIATTQQPEQQPVEQDSSLNNRPKFGSLHNIIGKSFMPGFSRPSCKGCILVTAFDSNADLSHTGSPARIASVSIDGESTRNIPLEGALWQNLSNGEHTITVIPPAGYSAHYSPCEDCTNHNAAGFTLGNSAQVFVDQNHFVSVRWLFMKDNEIFKTAVIADGEDYSDVYDPFSSTASDNHKSMAQRIKERMVNLFKNRISFSRASAQQFSLLPAAWRLNVPVGDDLPAITLSDQFANILVRQVNITRERPSEQWFHPSASSWSWLSGPIPDAYQKFLQLNSNIDYYHRLSLDVISRYPTTYLSTQEYKSSRALEDQWKAKKSAFLNNPPWEQSPELQYTIPGCVGGEDNDGMGPFCYKYVSEETITMGDVFKYSIATWNQKMREEGGARISGVNIMPANSVEFDRAPMKIDVGRIYISGVGGNKVLVNPPASMNVSGLSERREIIKADLFLDRQSALRSGAIDSAKAFDEFLANQVKVAQAAAVENSTDLGSDKPNLSGILHDVSKSFSGGAYEKHSLLYYIVHAAGGGNFKCTPDVIGKTLCPMNDVLDTLLDSKIFNTLVISSASFNGDAFSVPLRSIPQLLGLRYNINLPLPCEVNITVGIKAGAGIWCGASHETVERYSAKVLYPR